MEPRSNFHRELFSDPFWISLQKSFLYRAQAVFWGRIYLNGTYLVLWVIGCFDGDGIFPSSRLDLLCILMALLYAIFCYQYKGHRSYSRWLHFLTLLFDLALHLFFTRQSGYLLSPLMAIHPLMSAAFLLLFHNPLLMLAPLFCLPAALFLSLPTIKEHNLTGLISSLVLIAGLDALVTFFIHLPHGKEHRLLRSMVALEKKLKEFAIIKERQRIAREFHDGVGAKMASIVMQCDYLYMTPMTTEKVMSEIAEIKDSAMEAIDDMRRSISFLNGEFDITEQIEMMTEKMGHRHKIKINQKDLDLLRLLNTNQQVACCRIIQEGLTNALKHAKAHSINLAVMKSASHLSLIISDDGVGFDPTIAHQHRFGIKNMMDRAKQSGGRLTHHSAPNAGTKIVLEIGRAHV